MRKITSLKCMFAVVMALFSLSASAQFKAYVEQQVNTTYAPTYAEFKMSEVAPALQTDTATLRAALDAWLASGEAGYVNEDTKMFGILDSLGTDIETGYNADGRGSYWLNLDGTLGAWGENQVYNGLLQYSTNPDEDYLVIPLGHYPNTVGTASLSFLMQYNGNKVDFAITYVITPLPEAPEAVTDISQIHLYDSVAVTTERYSTNGYETTTVNVNAAGIAEALGVEKSELANYFAQDVYVEAPDSINCKSNTLQLLSLTDGWLGQAYLNFDGSVGDPVENTVIGCEYANSPYYYIQGMEYNADNDTITFLVGQMPSKLKTGENWTVRLYIMNGDKAFAIDHTLSIVEPPYQGLEDMTQVGYFEIVKEQYPTTDYSTTAINIDTDEAASLLGCDAASLSLKALDPNGGFSAQTTANNGGWWFNKAGYVTSWASGEEGSYFFIEPAESGVYSSLNMGQFPGDYAAGDSAVTDLFLVGGQNYVKYHIVLNIVEKPEIDSKDWVLSGSRSLTVQQLANDGYVWSDQTATIKADDLYNLIGTTDPVLYGEVLGDDGAVKMSDDYTMGETPGFWMTSAGYAASWGNNTTWGMTANATTTGATGGDYCIKCMQFPGYGVVDSIYSGKFYLVNLDNGKYVRVTLTNKVVDAIIDTEVVGEGSINVPVSAEGAEVEFDLEAIAEAIGTTTDDMANSKCMRGSTGASVPTSTGLTFDANGYVSDEGIFGFVFDSPTVMYVYSNEDMADDWTISTDVYFENEGKQYILHVTFMSKVLYDGVESVNANLGSKGAIYDLQGRRVSKAIKGLYIQDGQKFIVK